MSTFDIAVIKLLKNEGGLVDDPTDPGGITNYGISLAFLKNANIHINDDGVIDAQDIRDLTSEKASAIYKEYFWDKYGYSNIHNQSIATKMLDMSVNTGPYQAHLLIQRACWALGEFDTPIDDGILGEKTLREINRWDIALLSPLKAELAGFYRLLAATKPYQAKKLKGWLARNYST